MRGKILGYSEEAIVDGPWMIYQTGFLTALEMTVAEK